MTKKERYTAFIGIVAFIFLYTLGNTQDTQETQTPKQVQQVRQSYTYDELNPWVYFSYYSQVQEQTKGIAHALLVRGNELTDKPLISFAYKTDQACKGIVGLTVNGKEELFAKKLSNGKCFIVPFGNGAEEALHKAFSNNDIVYVGTDFTFSTKYYKDVYQTFDKQTSPFIAK